jgi:hypothetical protein
MVWTDVPETTPGVVSFRVTRVPASTRDYVVLATLIGLQVALAWFVWWSRRHNLALKESQKLSADGRR